MFSLLWRKMNRKRQAKLNFSFCKKKMTTLPLHQAIKYLKAKVTLNEKEDICGSCHLRCLCPILFQNDNLNQFTIKYLKKYAPNMTDINNNCEQCFTKAWYTSNGIRVSYRHQICLKDWEQKGVFLTDGYINKGDFITCFPGTIYRLPHDLEYTFVEDSGIIHLPEWLINNPNLLRLYDPIKGCNLMVDGHPKGESAINFLYSLQYDRSCSRRQFDYLFKCNPALEIDQEKLLFKYKEHMVINSPLLNWLDFENVYERPKSLHLEKTRYFPTIQKSRIWRSIGNFVERLNDYNSDFTSRFNISPIRDNDDIEERNPHYIIPGVENLGKLYTGYELGVHSSKQSNHLLAKDTKLNFTSVRGNFDSKNKPTSNENDEKEDNQYHKYTIKDLLLIKENEFQKELLMQSILTKQMSLGSFINYTEDMSSVNVEFQLIHLPFILPCYLQDYIPNVMYKTIIKGIPVEATEGRYCAVVVAKKDIGSLETLPVSIKQKRNVRQKKPVELLAHKSNFGIQ